MTGIDINPVTLKRANLPKVHWKCTIEGIPDKCPHKDKVVNWLTDAGTNIDKGKGLFIRGVYGYGKSGIASLCLKAALASGHWAYWIRTYAMAGQVINNEQFNDEMSIQERITSVPLLILDEVQLRDKTGYIELAIENVVRHRLDENLCTIITTNHRLDELKKTHVSMMSAVSESMSVIQVDGHNFRAKNGTEGK